MTLEEICKAFHAFHFSLKYHALHLFKKKKLYIYFYLLSRFVSIKVCISADDTLIVRNIYIESIHFKELYLVMCQ